MNISEGNDGVVLLHVDAPPDSEYANPNSMSDVDESIRHFQGRFVVTKDDGLPERFGDGSWLVEVFDSEKEHLIRWMLESRYGLRVYHTRLCFEQKGE